MSTPVIEFDLPKASAEKPKREPIPLRINGEDTGHKIYAPSTEHITLFSRVGSRMATPMDKMAGIFKFLEAVTDEDSYTYIIDRYEDPDDPMDFEWLTGFLVKMAELFNESSATISSAIAKK